MAGFTLDDVRDTFAADMSSLIDGMEGAARGLLGAQALSLAIPVPEVGASFFDLVANSAHAVHGSSSLVGVESMRKASRVLEQLARDGHQALESLQAQVAEVRRVASLCAEASGELRGLLALELEGQPEEAGARSTALTARLTRHDTPAPLASPGSAIQAAPEFDFSEPPTAPAAGPGGDLHQELLEVFQHEARELLVALQGQLQALAARPAEAGPAIALERSYHTLKGASATVGLPVVSGLAAQLQGRFEEVVEAGAPVTPELLQEVLHQTNRLLREARLPELPLDVLAPDGQAPGGERARGFFLEEAEGILKEAGGLVEHLGSAGPDDRPALGRQLALLFHRLKGSALVQGDEEVARTAVRLQREAEVGGAAAALAQGLADLAALVRRPQGPGAAAPLSEPARALRIREPVPPIEPELLAALTQECQELLEAVDREVFALEQSAQPKQELQRLMRLVHTLKGAVNSAGLRPTGAVLHAVEDFLERLAEAPILPSMKSVTSFLLGVEEEVRANLATAPRGYLESGAEAIRVWAQRVYSGEQLELAPASGAATGESTLEGRSGDRQQIRVSTQRLDELMNLAGELVVSRSRLLSRVGVLRGLQGDLGRSRRTLLARVEDFRQRYEFADLGGGRGRARVVARASGARAPGWSGFGALELDRYEDVHILARSLAEITDDFTEMDQQLTRELAQIADDSDGLSTLISRIQVEVNQARMVEVESLFARLRLPARDAAEREGKEAVVRFEQSSVTLDKSIVDALFAPMLHLVRNAVSHGLEAPADRERAGKPRQGTVVLRARQESGQVVIEVSDDGRGLDLEALRARGVEAGRVSPQAPLDSPEIRDLVFAPGVSTAAEVGEVAGRGVGGDVVRRAVLRLNGHVSVSTEAGRGTTFSITLPLTLAITQCLLVRVGERLLALPLFFIERIVDLEDARGAALLDSRQLRVGEGWVPVRRLEALLGEPEPARGGPVVLLRIGDRRLAVQADALLAREEVVVKRLGDLLHGHPLFAGVTVRGNGDLVLVVDIPGLLDSAARPDAAASEAPAPAPAPAPVPAPSPPAAPPARPRAVPAPALAPRVLFVDDSLSVRKVAEKLLGAMGVVVTLAVDGADALEKLRAGEFDLVFTDLEMPRVHGYELIRDIRFLPRLKSLPVVVVSSRAGTKHQEQARSLGATEYLTKPFNAQVLAAVLRTHLGFVAREG